MKPKLKVVLMISNFYQASLCLSRENRCFTHKHIFSTGFKKKATPQWEEEMGAWMYCIVPAVFFLFIMTSFIFGLPLSDTCAHHGQTLTRGQVSGQPLARYQTGECL